jgi:single-strand DNA-binding protein
VHQFIKKGSLLCIEGKLHNRQYSDKEGNNKYLKEIVAEQILLLDKKEKAEPAGTAMNTEEPMPF